MFTLPTYRRIVLLTEGRLGVFSSKTAAALLRYRATDVVAVLDSVAAGGRIREHIPWAPPDLPIVADWSAASALEPDALFVGIAPVGGALPGEMRCAVGAALRNGVDVVSGLHTRLHDDPEFAVLAQSRGAALIDLRSPPQPPTVASGRARQTRARRILTVGTDCNVGKMVAALELNAAARRRGIAAEFAATGQTGMMIAGRGVAIDAVIADFAAGAVEELVLACGGGELCFVEGQGSISHPGYSGVTLALLHGACPDALVLVHHAGRDRFKAEPHHPMPPLRQLCDAYVSAAALLHPARVVGVALNCHGTPPDLGAAQRAQIARELRLPVVDVYADDLAPLLGACLG